MVFLSFPNQHYTRKRNTTNCHIILFFFSCQSFLPVRKFTISDNFVTLQIDLTSCNLLIQSNQLISIKVMNCNCIDLKLFFSHLLKFFNWHFFIICTYFLINCIVCVVGLGIMLRRSKQREKEKLLAAKGELISKFFKFSNRCRSRSKINELETEESTDQEQKGHMPLLFFWISLYGKIKWEINSTAL